MPSSAMSSGVPGSARLRGIGCRYTWRETDKGVALQCRLSSDVFKDFFRKESDITTQMQAINPCPDGKHEPTGCDWCKMDKKHRPMPTCGSSCE
jgi:hypothetical protein